MEYHFVGNKQKSEQLHTSSMVGQKNAMGRIRLFVNGMDEVHIECI